MQKVVYYTLTRHVIKPERIASAAVWTCATCDNPIDGMGGPGNGEICEDCAKRILAGNGKLRKQGFASMSKERHEKVSAKGGKNTPPEDRNFALDPDLASSAGAKGGMTPRKGK